MGREATRQMLVLVLSLVVVASIAVPALALDGSRSTWGDLAAVQPGAEPSDQLPAEDPAASPNGAPDFDAWWAMTHTPATAWPSSDASAQASGQIPQWRYLHVIGPGENERVPTIDPRTNAQAWVDVSRIGPVGPPPEVYFGDPPPDTTPLGVPARIVGNPDTYEVPLKEHYFSYETLQHNQRVTAEGLVEMEDGSNWYRLGERRYIQTAGVRTPRPTDRKWEGRWIDADLREPAMVTAYEGDRPIYSALAVKGLSASQTPLGAHRIIRRVANEIMDSATLGIPRNSANGYYLRDVLFTQYFTGDGAAIHYNYWRSNWGYAGSRGCLGLNYDDSAFFWDFASIGTPIYIHN